MSGKIPSQFLPPLSTGVNPPQQNPPLDYSRLTRRVDTPFEFASSDSIQRTRSITQPQKVKPLSSSSNAVETAVRGKRSLSLSDSSKTRSQTNIFDQIVSPSLPRVAQADLMEILNILKSEHFTMQQAVELLQKKKMALVPTLMLALLDVKCDFLFKTELIKKCPDFALDSNVRSKYMEVAGPNFREVERVFDTIQDPSPNEVLAYIRSAFLNKKIESAKKIFDRFKDIYGTEEIYSAYILGLNSVISNEKDNAALVIRLSDEAFGVFQFALQKQCATYKTFFHFLKNYDGKFEHAKHVFHLSLKTGFCDSSILALYMKIAREHQAYDEAQETYCLAKTLDGAREKAVRDQAHTFQIELNLGGQNISTTLKTGEYKFVGVMTLNFYMLAMGNKGDFSEAKRIFEELGEKANSTSVLFFLRVCRDNAQLEEATRAFKMAEQRRIYNSTVYCVYLSSLEEEIRAESVKDKYKEAESIFDTCVKRNYDEIEIYTSHLLTSYEIDGLDAANRVYNLFKERLIPDKKKSVDHIWADFLFKDGKIVEAKKVYEEEINVTKHFVIKDQALDLHEFRDGTAVLHIMNYTDVHPQNHRFEVIPGKGIHSKNRPPFALRDFLLEHLPKHIRHVHVARVANEGRLLIVKKA